MPKAMAGVPSETPNWSKFYEALVYFGPMALEGIPVDWVRWFQDEGAASDWFWSEDIYESLCDGWSGSPVLAIEQAVSRFVESVQAGLCELPVTGSSNGWLHDAESGQPMPWSECVARVRCRKLPRQILDALLSAARQPMADDDG